MEVTNSVLVQMIINAHFNHIIWQQHLVLPTNHLNCVFISNEEIVRMVIAVPIFTSLLVILMLRCQHMNINSINKPNLLDSNGQWRRHLTTNMDLTHQCIRRVHMHLVHHNLWVCLLEAVALHIQMEVEDLAVVDRLLVGVAVLIEVAGL